MENPLSNLRNKILEKKTKSTGLTPIIKLIRELGCFSDIVGSNYEVYDKNGELVYTIKKKPITAAQLYNFSDELNNLELSENESNKNSNNPRKGKK